jgi:TRAP-type C4-dicarboxylate transport system substrate-binding protein
LATLAAIALGAPVQARDFRVSDIYPADTPTVQALAYMNTIVERQSYGRLHIKPPSEADRDSENFTVAQVRNGTLDMARVSLPTLNAAIPSTALLGAPYLLRSSAHAQRVLEGPIGAEILADFPTHDLIGLCFFDAGARSLYTVNKPVKTIGDVKGLRVRAQPGDIASTFWQSFGAIPTVLPYSRISDALRTNVLDGATGNWVSFIAGGHYKSVKYFSPTEHARPPSVVIFSRKVWLALPESDRTIIAAAAKDAAARQNQLLERYDIEARRTAEAAGVSIVTDLDLNSFTAPMQQLYDKLYPEPKQQSMLKRIQAAAAGT